MPSQITNYQCPACTGPLHFVGASGRLECEYCGSSYSVAEIEALYAKKEEAAVQANEAAQAAQAAAEQQAAQLAQEGWDIDAAGEAWGAEGEGMKAYNCPSCGAQLICDATTAATSCPYCGNPTVVPGQFAGTKKPDLIIPFKLSKEDAVKALSAHYKGKPLLAKAFSNQNHIEEIQGVYVPFWLFDGTADADVNYEATRSHVRETPRERIITTEHYNVYRSGQVGFSNVPVDASSKMPDAHMDSIEPYDYSALTRFSTAYLPGFLADKYDVEQEDCSRRADVRCEESALEAMASTVTGYESVTPLGHDVRLHRGKVKYALLPVWMLSTKWNGQTFLFAMNGQTGKLIGDLPVSKGRFWGWFGAIFAPLAALLALFLLH